MIGTLRGSCISTPASYSGNSAPNKRALVATSLKGKEDGGGWWQAERRTEEVEGGKGEQSGVAGDCFVII